MGVASGDCDEEASTDYGGLEPIESRRVDTGAAAGVLVLPESCPVELLEKLVNPCLDKSGKDGLDILVRNTSAKSGISHSLS
jgi:hypothetical protein